MPACWPVGPPEAGRRAPWSSRRRGPKCRPPRLPSLFSALTVIALGVLAGDDAQASPQALPAATVVVTLAETKAVVAALMAALNEPSKLMFATAGSTRLAATQLIPVMSWLLLAAAAITLIALSP